MSEEVNNVQPVEPVLDEVKPVIEVAAPVEEKPKAKKQKVAKEEAPVNSDSVEAKYLLLKEAARNLIKQYSKNHTVRGPEDLRFPGLRELAEALKD